MSKVCKKISDSKVLMVLAVLLLIALYFLRCINLDQDLPAWGIAEYQPKDEGAYVSLAISEWEYGTLNPTETDKTGLGYEFYTPEHLRSNIIGNLLNIVSFHVFGDNYYGMRMPMIVLGFLNLALLGIILLELRKKYGKHSSSELWGIIGILLLISHHFYFYLSTRTVEPSTLRMLFAQLTMLIWLKSRKKGTLCFFLMGISITVSVFLVYITNVFLYLAVGLLLLLIWKQAGFKKFFQNACAFAAGIVIIFVAAEVYYYVVWDTFAITNLLDSIGLFTGTSGYELTSGGILSVVWGLIRGAIRYFSSNFFLYSPALLALTILLFPVAVWSAVREKDQTIFLLLAVPVSFLLQTMVSEDYIWRKFLVVCPYVIYLIYWGILNCGKFAGLLEAYQVWCGKIGKKNLQITAKLVIPGYIALSALVPLCVAFYRFNMIEGLGERDFTGAIKLLVMVLGCLPVLAMAAVLILTLIRDKEFPLKRSVLLLGGTILLLGLSLLFLCVWQNPTFAERDSMISLSEEHGLDGKYVIGDFVVGITLYNDLKPVTQPHTVYSARMIDRQDMLLHHYADIPDHLDADIFNRTSLYTAEKVITIPGSLQVNGETRDFALYTARLRSETVKGMRDEREEYEEKILQLQETLWELEQKNESMTAGELISEESAIIQEVRALKEYYEDNFDGDTILFPVYTDTYDDIRGDIKAPVYGNIYGDIYGDIKAVIYGDVYGNINGNIYVKIEGNHYGKLNGVNHTH